MSSPHRSMTSTIHVDLRHGSYKKGEKIGRLIAIARILKRKRNNV